jgi:hypothetical protein
MPEITKEKNGRKEQIMSKERRTWEDDVGCLNCESLSAANAELKAENSDLQKQVADLAIECGFKELKEENARLRAGLEKKWICNACGEAENCDLNCIISCCVGAPVFCPISNDETEWREVSDE